MTQGTAAHGSTAARYQADLVAHCTHAYTTTDRRLTGAYKPGPSPLHTTHTHHPPHHPPHTPSPPPSTHHLLSDTHLPAFSYATRHCVLQLHGTSEHAHGPAPTHYPPPTLTNTTALCFPPGLGPPHARTVYIMHRLLYFQHCPLRSSCGGSCADGPAAVCCLLAARAPVEYLSRPSRSIQPLSRWCVHSLSFKARSFRDT